MELLDGHRNNRILVLHGSAIAARQVHGTLTALSEGSERGATFSLKAPIHPPEANAVLAAEDDEERSGVTRVGNQEATA
jgi:hypothetical protein